MRPKIVTATGWTLTGLIVILLALLLAAFPDAGLIGGR